MIQNLEEPILLRRSVFPRNQRQPRIVSVATIAGIRPSEGTLYLCAVKDLYSNRIVGYSIDSRMTASLAVSALQHAISARSPSATIVHADRGSQFRSRKYVNALVD